MNMKTVLSAALLMVAVSANADTVITKGANGGLVAKDVKTTAVTAKAQGAGCVTTQELMLGYKNFNVLQHMFGTKRCALIDVGDKLDLVNGTHIKGNPLVQIYAGEGIFFYVPGYVFGFKE